jgi:hypothetical protein
MKAFLISVVLLIAVALSTGYLLDDFLASDAGSAFSTDNVRL